MYISRKFFNLIRYILFIHFFVNLEEEQKEQRKQRLMEDNEEEEAMMKKLEKDLGIRTTKTKGKKLPKSFLVSTKIIYHCACVDTCCIKG